MALVKLIMIMLMILVNSEISKHVCLKWLRVVKGTRRML